MAQPQTAICAENRGFAVYLTTTLCAGPDSAATVRKVASGLAALTAEVAAETGEDTLVSAIAFGAAVWMRLFGTRAPRDLVAFEPLADGPRQAPATPADLLIHIHSSRHDVNCLLARRVMAALDGAVHLEEEIHGFRHLDGRDLTGFVDGTENPKGDERAPVALVGDEQPDFAAGSYVSIQRYVHDLAAWNRQSVEAQEAAIGRTKADDRELDDEIKPASAHIARVVIEQDGDELQILRHSLPYGTSAEHGLYFVAYGRDPAPFRRMLERMVIRDADGQYDRLLDFSRPVTGAAFFAPSRDFLAGLA